MSRSVLAENTRRAIRDAMERLIQGKPIRSDGKLTVKSLADEAGVKRWVLTHQYTDLQSEFRSLIANQSEIPNVLHLIEEDNKALKGRISKLLSEVTEQAEENNRLARVIQVLTLENIQMREVLDENKIKVHYLRTT
jgi:hypothetical protein